MHICGEIDALLTNLWKWGVDMLSRPFQVAWILFLWASEQGFIGVAVYTACWVFLFPVMVGICTVGAYLGWFADKIIAINDKELEAIGDANRPRDKVEERQWEEEDKRYRATKEKLLASSKNQRP